MKTKLETTTRRLLATGIIGFFFVALALFAKAQAPSTVAGDGVLVQYTSGTPPLVSYGYSMFLLANSGNAYQLIGIYPTGGNSGTYSYQRRARIQRSLSKTTRPMAFRSSSP
jgi:hypothetical protein